MRTPGVEPGSQAWEACMMPLHYVRSRYLQRLRSRVHPSVLLLGKRMSCSV
jgi:hypothetical protein